RSYAYADYYGSVLVIATNEQCCTTSWATPTTP
ncbi:hypothetical protein GCK32_010668, partial [Trichostrongylus colubriformis]